MTGLRAWVRDVAADVRRRTHRPIGRTGPPRHLGGYESSGFYLFLTAPSAQSSAANGSVSRCTENQTSLRNSGLASKRRPFTECFIAPSKSYCISGYRRRATSAESEVCPPA